MKILIAEDDTTTRLILEAFVTQWGHTAVLVSDGNAAMTALRGNDAPLVAILDWMMPGFDGIEICRRLRATQKNTYILLVTARDDRASLVEGLDAGANDYVTKPFDREELRARLQVGVRYAQLQETLEQRLAELETASHEIGKLKRQLNIPI
jgi:DNA-binding response OmpR family regulator